MDIKKVSWIGIILGIMLIIKGIWAVWDWVYYQGFFDNLNILFLIIGTYFFWVSLKIAHIFSGREYKREYKVFWIFSGILIVVFLILFLSGILSKSTFIISLWFAIFYFTTMTTILWLFIRRWALQNPKRIRGKPFEYIFFVFLFVATYYANAVFGKMSMNSWSLLDVEIVINIFIITIFYSSALFSGYIHYIDDVG